MAKDENKNLVLDVTALAVTDNAPQGVLIDGEMYVIANRVNLPTLKHEVGKTVAFRIDQPIRQEVNYQEVEVDVPDEANPGMTKKMKARKENIINVVRVTEITSKQPHEYVCNAMTADNLRGAYPGDGYVGKTFAVFKGERAAGKQYMETQVVEISAAKA